MATETIHQRIEREREQTAPMGGSWQKAKGSWSLIREFRDYARGRQRKTLNADQIRILQACLKHDASDNVLRKILWTHANRLRVARFDVDDSSVDAFLFDTWVRNSFPDLFADAIFSTLRDGNHALSLAWRASDDPSNVYGGRVVLARERWWDGREGMFVMYGDDAQPSYAVKEWTPLGPQPQKRRTIYFPDRIQRYIQDGGWRSYNIPGDEDFPAHDADGKPIANAVAWVKRDGSPLGIPVIHFANGSDDDSYYGASLLDGGPLGFQDHINAIQHDILAASMLNGSPQTWSKGFSLPDDPNDSSGQTKLSVKTGPGMHHHTEEPTAAWGTIPPGSLGELKDAYMTKLEALCRMLNTPLHAITGQWPSGEALFRAEIDLVNAVKKLGESVGPSTSTVMHRATEIVNTFGSASLDENALIQTVFEPPEQRDVMTNWQVAAAASPFVSEREVLRIAGYAPDRIDQIMDERDEERAASVSAAQAAFAQPPSLDALQSAAGASIDTTAQDGSQSA